MRHSLYSIALLAAGFLTLGCGDSVSPLRSPHTPSRSLAREHGRSAFGLNGTVVSSTGQIVSLSGGGSFDPTTASDIIPSSTSGHGEGGFGCVTDVTISPLAGCARGEGTHWETAQLLQSSGFKCGGVPNEQGKTATTSANVIVLLARFHRSDDRDAAPFTAKMFVSASDLAPDIPGIQNIWIQGFGCGTGVVNFNN